MKPCTGSAQASSRGQPQGDVLARNRLITRLSGLAAQRALTHPLLMLQAVFATLPLALRWPVSQS
jgi:hypothetical protein